jgi:hypothetical protein
MGGGGIDADWQRKASGKRIYIMTRRQSTSGEELKHLNRVADLDCADLLIG